MKFLFLLILVSCNSNTSFDLKLLKDINISDAAKMTTFKGGQKIESPHMEKEGNYCAFENYQLKDAVFAAGEELEIKLERMEFPNKKIIRYAAWTSAKNDFSLF